MDKKILCEIIERDKEELFELLSSLIKINSENFGEYGNETECAEYVKKYFDDLGIDAEVYSPLEIENIEAHKDYYAGRNLENRKNCTAYLTNNHHRKLMLAAHHDTVEIGDEANWDVPPLGGIMKDGKIYGRGACDDKYGIAIAMFLMKKIKELGIELDYDLLFTAYCDEEYGGGNGALATCLKYPCDDYLNIDGLEDEIWPTGCGGGQVVFKVSTKDAVNNCSLALKGLNLVAEKLDGFKKNRIEELEKNPWFSGTWIARDSMRIMSFSIGGAGGTDMGKGCLDITYYTDRTKEEIDAELNALRDDINAEFEHIGLDKLEINPTTRFFRYVNGEKNSPIISLLKDAGKKNGIDFKVEGACLSDLPMFFLYGSPTAITFGLGGAFDRPGGAHQPNEYIECDKLLNYTKAIADVIGSY